MILRTELRRSSAMVIGIGFLASALALTYGLSGPWTHGSAQWNEQWTGLGQWPRYLMSFLWPLVLAGGAWQGMRDGRSRVTELFATTPKATWRRVLPTVGALALTLTAAYVVLLVIGGVQVARTASYGHLKWLPVAGVMVLALVSSAVLGMGIGRLVPSPLTPPVVAVAALAAQAAVLVQSSWPLLLTAVFDAPDVSVFRTVAVPVTLAQAVWFVGVGAAGFCVLAARRKIVALLPLALAAAVAVPVLYPYADATVADPDARALVCDDDGPRVCMTRAHADDLPTVAGPAREALAQLAKLPSPPTSVVEVPPDEKVGPLPPGATPLYLLVPPDDAEMIRLMVLGGVGMPLCENDRTGESMIRRDATRIIVMSWLTGKLAPLPGYEYVWETAHTEIKQAWRELRTLAPGEQAAKVATWRDATLTCRDEVAL